MAAFVKGENDLVTWCQINDRHDIIEEFDLEKNQITPDDLMFGSNAKVWWKCKNGHSYFAPVCDRTRRGRVCLYCNDRRVLKGYNDIATLFPELIDEWDFIRNKKIVSPDAVTKISNIVVWWKCPKGHSFEARISHRTERNLGCPYCSGHRALKGFNDLMTVVPEVAKQWDYEKNEAQPYEFTKGSGEYAWWICRQCGESYRRSIVNQVKESSICPKCALSRRTINRRISIVQNRGSITPLESLLEEWDYQANDKNGTRPEDITRGSNKRVWWKCAVCGHRWLASVSSRTRDNATGCPECGKEKASRVRYSNMLVNRKRLSETESKVLQEWDYDKNGDLTPKDILETSGKSCWWICKECGHSWKTRVYNRSIRGIGCPNCAKERQSSFPEQAIFYYLQQMFPDAINSDKHIGKELDIYIPSKDSAIEYDGMAFHGNSGRDEGKNRLCQKNGITLYRVREIGCPPIKEVDGIIVFWYKYGDWKTLGRIIANIADMLGVSVDADIERDQTKIYELFLKKKKDNNLQKMFPEIAQEWNYSKNGKVLPSMVFSGSEKRFWWVCPKGHEWESSVAARTSSERGCPYCARQRLLVGFNDLATCFPEIAKEWDYEKNNGLRPKDVIGGAKKIWWKCPNNHSYQTTINSRTSNGTGCPYCSGHMAIEGVSDLFTERPELRDEWDFEKNKGIDPKKLKRGSGKKVWWICPKGHSYDATIVQRLKSNCPICVGKRVIAGVNDLATLEPELVKEWDYEKNTFSPQSVTRMSSKRVWWRCSLGHSYQTGISDRVQYSTGCPICCNKIIVQGYNDLQTTHPEIANEWNRIKNAELLPTMIGAGTSRKVWWICTTCGHEWNASVASRTSGRGCPQCGMKRSARAKLRRIINLDTGEVFDGIKYAKIKYPVGNIVKCLNGGSKTACGFHWAYYRENVFNGTNDRGDGE